MSDFNALQDTNFQDILDSLELLKTQVEAWRDKAAEWAENAEDEEVESGEYSARHHALKAEAERIAAEAAKVAAEAAQTASESAKDDSETAQAAAEAAQEAAGIAAGVAGDQASDAATAASAAQAAQSASEAAQSASEDAQTGSETARDDAVIAKNDAEAAAGLSIQGIKVNDRLDDTSEYPATPDAGDAYVIENSSTEEDEIHLWTGSDWTVFPVGSGTNWGQISGNLTNQSDLSSALAAKLATSLKGSVNGLAELDGDGRVPSTQLPSYVDDVLEYADEASFPAEGETGKIYVAKDVNLTFRWTGSAYVEISPSIALGETSQTAYRGDRGKTAYDHSQIDEGNPHGTTASDVGADTSSEVNTKIENAKNENFQARTSAWTLAVADSHRTDRCTSASDVNATVPPNSAQAFPVGYWRLIRQAGEGVVTAVAGSGVTLNGPAKTAGENTGIMLVKVAADEWDIYGGVE